ncbi:hypothetical protein ACFE04_010597 [Oxalis oulophora]
MSAFHVACPITNRRICYCNAGFPAHLQSDKARREYENQIHQLQEFISDPWGSNSSRYATVQVSVPKLVITTTPPPSPQPQPVSADDETGGSVDQAAVAAPVSDRAKLLSLRRKAPETVDETGDQDHFTPNFKESGDQKDINSTHTKSVKMKVVPEDTAGEEQDQSNGHVMCCLCFVGENKRSESAREMISCKSCDEKYHRNCVETLSKHRGMVCRRTGNPSKLMFCKRCDDAYHCYCQNPPQKNVSPGPFLCPKHASCYSCASTVPGTGLSVRWFLGHTCCDACGRLFVKGNYCPICLKVYTDSESTPMVCCDDCQCWVHCQCDGISEARYHQYQVDESLEYKCATCRGECSRIKDVEDAVQELWRRKDKTDKKLIASLRATAGLPTEEEIFSIGDEEDDPVTKNETGLSIKLSLKGLPDKSAKKTKDYGKKYFRKRGQKKGQSLEHPMDDKKETHLSSPVTGVVNNAEVTCSVNQPRVLERKFVDDVMVRDEDKRSNVIKFKISKPQVRNSEDDGANKSKAVKARKLIINLGARKIKPTTSSGSDASSYQREINLVTSTADSASQLKGLKSSGKESNNKKSVDDEMVVPEDNRRSLRGKRGKIDDCTNPPASLSMQKDSKPVLKFKLKMPSAEIMDASSILRTLGNDAIGKIVEVHEPSDDTWHRGVVTEAVEGASTFSIRLHDGRLTSLTIGEQGVRLVPKKQKRTKRV